MDQLARDPLRGHLFENLVIAEAVKTLTNQGLEPLLYFFRDNHGLEVDLIKKNGSLITPIEIKSTATYRSDILKGLKKFCTLAKSKTEKATLIYKISMRHVC